MFDKGVSHVKGIQGKCCCAGLGAGPDYKRWSVGRKHEVVLRLLRGEPVDDLRPGARDAQHEKFSDRTGLKVYFADPHGPWQRGINENTNGLLCQYLTKGIDLSVFSQDEFATTTN